MRKLIYAINVTLDGVCDHHQPVPDDDILLHFAELVRNAGLLVYGRKTYELMVPYWPDIAKSQTESPADIEFAKAFVAADKIVFSRTLKSVDDSRTRIISSGLQEEIFKLKLEAGKDMLVGGIDLPSQLIKLGLVDEYHVVLQPIIAGGGRRLLEGASLPDSLRLKLIESKVYKSGCVVLHYTTY